MKKKEEIIEMSRYVNAEPVHEKCLEGDGCDRVFDWHGDEGTIVIQKCRVYPNPAMWWKQKPVATKEVLVRDKDHPKGIMKEFPVQSFRCPMATHVEAEATASSEKIRVGQQKQKRRFR